MTVTAIVSSPRRNGWGESITAKIIEGAQAAGKEVRIHRLNDMTDYKQCQNCECCKQDGQCILEDDLNKVIEDIRDCESLIICTSISFNEVNGLFKMMQDRMYCFLDVNASTILPKGKKLATVVTAGLDSGSAERVSAGLEKVFREHFFFEPVGRIAYTGWMMPLDMPIDDAVMNEAFEIGGRL